MYGWAPLAIMGEEINKLSPSSSSPSTVVPTSYTRRSPEDPAAVEMSSLMSDDPLSPGHDEAESSSSSSSPATIKIPRHHRRDLDAAAAAAADEDGGMAGIYLGIHNIFATVPQFLATFISMIVFSILEPGQSPELAAAAAAAAGGGGSEVEASVAAKEGNVVMGGLSGTAVCLAIGAVFQVVAAAQSLRMRRY